MDRLSTCYEQIRQAKDRIDLVDEPCRTMLLVDNAVGLIGNGGFQYFFESDFPHNPDYALFVEAFRRFGLDEIADGFAKLVAMFPFASPHLDVDQRNAFLDSEPHDFNSACERLERLVHAVSDRYEALQEDYLRRVESAA